MEIFVPCTCGTGGQNTGQPNCIPVIERTAMLIFMSTIADDGTKNTIKPSDLVGGILPDAFIQDKLNEADPSKRWYLTPKINTVEDIRAEPVTFEVDGIPHIIDQGVRTFTGSYFGKAGHPKFAAVLNSRNCFDNSYYEVSTEGAIVGTLDGDNLDPTPIETGTLFAGVVKKIKTALNSVGLSFNVQELVRDENLSQLSSSMIETDMLNQKGLIQLLGEALTTPVITTTEAVLKFTTCYGNYEALPGRKGLVVADLSPDNGVTTSTVFNVSTSANIAVASLVEDLTEGNEGQYLMTIPAAISGNVIRVDISRNGVDMEAFEYTIP